MENMGINNLFGNIYKNKTVLITGHTGFKGSWLSLWLNQLGANVIGYSLKPLTNPNHFELLSIKNLISIIDDIRNFKKLEEIIQIYKPDIVFHMAAQPLVRYSYKNPYETFEINIMGTINLFEACRSSESVKSIINITSDKCYENKEWVWGYRESDPMGGYDPYSASKGCVELVTNSYRNSFFNINEYKKTHNILLASVRAGNVIGGGDWAEDRLIPDIVKFTSKNKKVIIRNPKATRPWQHVLDPLAGYLMLGQKLLEGKKQFACAWNFGSDDESNVNVETLVTNMKLKWDKINYEFNKVDLNPHEANFLKLDCSKAHSELGWKSNWNFYETLETTTTWYKSFYENNVINSTNDLSKYIEDARETKQRWIQ
jgi:CDP-glucose 4,6-dehydratase